MKKILKFIFGGMLILFGTVILFGVILGLANGTSKYSLRADMIGAFCFGIVPLGGGGFLIRSALHESRAASLEQERALRERQEKEILHLAQQKGGRLSVLEIAAATSMDTTEAEALMHTLVKKGYVSIQVTDSGVMVYEFYGIGDSK